MQPSKSVLRKVVLNIFEKFAGKHPRENLNSVNLPELY